MKIIIACIGKTATDYIVEGISDYEKRLKHYAAVEWSYLPPVKGAAALSQDELSRREGELFLKSFASQDVVFLLDEKGKQHSSRSFAGFIEKQRLSSVKRVVFCIGGAYGFSQEVRARAAGAISLSSMTFPHDMVRLVFAEQLYRAMTILRGEPYHHD